MSLNRRLFLKNSLVINLGILFYNFLKPVEAFARLSFHSRQWVEFDADSELILKNNFVSRLGPEDGVLYAGTKQATGTCTVGVNCGDYTGGTPMDLCAGVIGNPCAEPAGTFLGKCRPEGCGMCSQRAIVTCQ